MTTGYTSDVCCACGLAPDPESADPSGSSELRPYGPNGAPICFTCAMLPERREETDRQYFARLDAAMAASIEDGSDVAHVLLTPDGPRPLRTGRA